MRRRNYITKEGEKMLRSMTGYGRSQKILNGRDISVEIRSVNHRYYEYTSRIPRTYSYIDEKLKAVLKTSVARGKVEVSVTINNIEGKDSQIAINKGVAEGYVTALRSISEELALKDDLTLSNLIRIPDVFNIQKTPATFGNIRLLPLWKAATKAVWQSALCEINFLSGMNWRLLVRI